MSICGTWEHAHGSTAFWGEGSVFTRCSKGSRLLELLKAVVLDRLTVLEAEMSWGVKSSYTPQSWAPPLAAMAPGGAGETQKIRLSELGRRLESGTVVSWKSS